jgi:hypothetical protein
VVFRRHPDIQAQTKAGSGSRHIERGPAPILFKPAGALFARVVQQPLPDVLPDRVSAIEAKRIDGLDLHGTLATLASDAQDVALYFRKPSLPQLGAICTGPRILQAVSVGSFSICFGVGMRQLAGRSVISRLEHKENECRVRPSYESGKRSWPEAECVGTSGRRSS